MPGGSGPEAALATALEHCIALCHQLMKQFISYGSDGDPCTCSDCPQGTYLNETLNYCQPSTKGDVCASTCAGQCEPDGSCLPCQEG